MKFSYNVTKFKHGKEKKDSSNDALKQHGNLTLMKSCFPPLQDILHFFCDFLEGVFF